MVRLCSESSCSYSGRSVTRARRQRRGPRPAMTTVREHESAEAIVSTESNEPGARDWPAQTQRSDGLTTREGLNLAGRHDHWWSCPGAMKPTGRATGQRSPWQRKSAAQSARTARNRRTRTRMYGGVGAGRGNPPGDPIRPEFSHAPCSFWPAIELMVPITGTRLPTVPRVPHWPAA
jgi:hypothetical protein